MLRSRRRKQLRGPRGRYIPSREMIPITRKEQQYLQKVVRVGKLVWRDYPMKSVSSTNIKAYGYYIGSSPAVGTLQVAFVSGLEAEYYLVPFLVWEEFYYAHSKGTFFYRFIRKGGYAWNYV